MPYNPNLVVRKMDDYVKKTVPNYQDYESSKVLERESTPEHLRGYAGYMKMYTLTYVNKKNDSLFFDVYTHGFDIESNYQKIALMLPYIEVAENIVKENIVSDEIKLIKIDTDLTGSFAETNKPSKEIVMEHSQRFIPYLEVIVPSDVTNWQEHLQQIDGKVTQYFNHGSYYTVKLSDGSIYELSHNQIFNYEFE